MPLRNMLGRRHLLRVAIGTMLPAVFIEARSAGKRQGEVHSGSPAPVAFVNSVTSLRSPFGTWWDQGGRAFTKWAITEYKIKGEYRVVENEGTLGQVISQLEQISKNAQGNIVFNIDLGTRYSAKAIAEVCGFNRIYFVTHGLGPADIRPWLASQYYVAHVADDHEMAGFKTGWALTAALRSRDCILALGGPKSDAAAELRKAGLDRALTRIGCTVTDYRLADWQPSSAFEIVRFWLEFYGNRISGIWAANDAMALGAIEALRVRRREGSIPVTGIDGHPEAIAAIQRGELVATALRDAFYEGGMGLAIAYSAKRGELIPQNEPNQHREFYLEVPLVDYTNCSQFAQYRSSGDSDVDWKHFWSRASTQR
jgi:ribose transport system substrate-binding protein